MYFLGFNWNITRADPAQIEGGVTCRKVARNAKKKKGAKGANKFGLLF